MNPYYEPSRELVEIFNQTNSTSLNEFKSYSDPWWAMIIWCGLFAYLLSCLFTVNIKMCDAKDYHDNMAFCCCLVYRDLLTWVIIIFVQILILIYECFTCKCCLYAKSKGIIMKKCNIMKNKVSNKCNKISQHCSRIKFKVNNTISPIQATMVENTNINTSIVIEGLNNKQEIVSIIVVPIDEMTV